MLSTAIVLFREIVEIAMILGIVLAATRGLAGRMRWILAGFAGGVAGAGLVAFFAGSIGQLMAGMGQEVFNAAILFSAALVIGWTVVWMRRHARAMSLHLRHVGTQAKEGTLPLYSLALIIGLALLREGSEIVLFIYGMLLSGQPAASIVSGSVAGVAAGTLVGVLIYYGLLKMSTRHMLRVTSWLLMLLVAGLASQGAGFLSAAGYFDGFTTPLWDSSWLLAGNSIVGGALHTLVGYNDQPTAIELIFYTGTLALLLGALALTGRHSHSHPAH